MTDAPPALRVEVHPDRDRVFLVLSGELDLSTSPVVEAQLAELRAVGFERFVLDLRALAFMDSSGVGLVARELETGAPKAFAVVPGTGLPHDVLAMTGVLDALPVVRERDAPLLRG